LKGLHIPDHNGDLRPSTPFELYFGRKPRVSRFRVFGCPIVAKAYTKKSESGRILDDRNIIQRGVRGIFLGFPINQAGYLYINPATREYGTSVDVSFDETFQSPLAYPDSLYHGAIPTRDPMKKALSSHPESVEIAGYPDVKPDPANPSEPWTPYTIFTPELDASPIPPINPAISTIIPDSQYFEQTTQTSDPDHETDSFPDSHLDSQSSILPSRRSRRLQGLSTNRQSLRLKGIQPDYSNFVNSFPLLFVQQACSSFEYFDPPQSTTEPNSFVFALSVLTEANPKADIPPGEKGSDPLPFIPEPTSLKQILKLPEIYRNPWLKAFHTELRGLIKDNQCFKIGVPVPPGSKPTRCMIIFKTKTDQFGKISKLKAHLVF
jgi:hypothetical protein